MNSPIARTTAKVLFGLAVVYVALVGIALLLTKVLDHSGLVTAENDVNNGLANHRDGPLNDVTGCCPDSATPPQSSARWWWWQSPCVLPSIAGASRCSLSLR